MTQRVRTRRRNYYFPLAALPLLMVLQHPNVSESFHTVSLTVFQPVLGLGHTVSHVFLKTGDAFQHFWQSFQDQKHLRERMSELEIRLADYEETKRENERLRGLLEFSKTVSSPAVTAQVIGWDPSPWRRSVILDKGTRHGLRKDHPVVVSQGLVGRISEAGRTSARVLFLLDTDSRVSVLLAESRAQGVLEGDGSAELKLRYLEMDESIQVGEEVLTSGAGGIFPKGIRVGRVVELRRDPDGLHFLARVQPFVPFTKLEEVLCLASSPRG